MSDLTNYLSYVMVQYCLGYIIMSLDSFKGRVWYVHYITCQVEDWLSGPEYKAVE